METSAPLFLHDSITQNMILREITFTLLVTIYDTIYNVYYYMKDTRNTSSPKYFQIIEASFCGASWQEAEIFLMLPLHEYIVPIIFSDTELFLLAFSILLKSNSSKERREVDRRKRARKRQNSVFSNNSSQHNFSPWNLILKFNLTSRGFCHSNVDERIPTRLILDMFNLKKLS